MSWSCLSKWMLLIFAMDIMNVSCTGCSRSNEDNASIVPNLPIGDEKVSEHAYGVIKEIEAEVDIAPQVILDGRNDRRLYVQRLCKRISEIGDLEARRRMFQRLRQRAFSVRFEDVGDALSKDAALKLEVRRRLGGVYASLELLADELQWHLMSSKASVKEQFEPWFMLYEKMRVEFQRVGTIGMGYPQGIKHIERMYGALVKTRMFKPEEFKWVETEFQRIAGRPIRTQEEEIDDVCSSKERDF